MSCLGLTVAKHGNKGPQKPNGSFDLLEYLEIPIDLTGEQIAHLLETVGLGFIYARKAHPAVRNVAEARSQIAGRTIFNLANPLSNPTDVFCQLIGTADEQNQRRLLETAKLLGRKRATVVYGEPGIDEVSIAGPTRILTLSNVGVIEKRFLPEEIGISTRSYSELPTGNAEVNAKVFERLLENDSLNGIRDMVCLNAALMLVVAEKVSDPPAAFKLAEDIIRSGQMKEKYLQYKRESLKICTNS